MKRLAVILGWILILAMNAHADSMTTAFPDPSRPGSVYLPSGNGDVTVIAHDRDDVIIESDQTDFRAREETNARARGLQRLAGSSTRVEIDESSNTIEIVRSFSIDEDITVRVPAGTSVYIGDGIINGDIEISGISGSIRAKTMGGVITLENISSDVNAMTMGGNIEIIIDRNVETDNPLMVSTMGGDIDVTMPAGIEANVKLSTMSGDMFTDFDIQRDTSGALMEQEKEIMAQDAEREGRSAGRGSEDIIRIPKTPRPFMFTGNPPSTFYGSINGGGRFISLGTMGGNIYFRKK